jgi:hypothetical protein
MKLYLTLEDDDGSKIEKVLLINGTTYFGTFENVVNEMIDSLLESKKPL